MVEELSGPMNSEWSLGEHMPMPLDLARVDGWEKAEQIPGTKIQKDINGLYCIPNFTEFGGAFTSRFFFDQEKSIADVIITNKGRENWVIVYGFITSSQFVKKGEATKLILAIKEVFEPQYLFGISTSITLPGENFIKKLQLTEVPIELDDSKISSIDIIMQKMLGRRSI